MPSIFKPHIHIFLLHLCGENTIASHLSFTAKIQKSFMLGVFWHFDIISCQCIWYAPIIEDNTMNKEFVW